MNPGYCYLVTRHNDWVPDLSRVKIGYFTADKIEREIYNNYARSLTPLYIIDIIPTSTPKLTENIIHHALDPHRINAKHEIFDLNGRMDLVSFVIEKIQMLDELSRKAMPWRTHISYLHWENAKNAAQLAKHWARKRLERSVADRERVRMEAKRMGEISKNKRDMLKIMKKSEKHVDKCKDKLGIFPLLMKHFDITGNIDDFVVFSDIFRVVNQTLQLNKKTLGDELTALGMQTKYKWIPSKSKTESCRLGIKIKNSP